MSIKKIAGVSIDKWLEGAKPEKKPKLEKEKYDYKLIAFLDILGVKDLVQTNKDGNEFIAINTLAQIRKIVESSTKIIQKTESVDYLQLSDSFVFVSDPENIIPLLKLLSTVQMRIIHETNFLLRGAITIGDAIVQDENKVIIGPAYIQAYQLQEEDAIYPRVIVSQSVINKIKEHDEEISYYLEQDLDKEYYIDYIKVFMSHEDIRENDMKARLRRNDTCNSLTNKFQDFYLMEKHNICQKYGWTIQYYKKKGVWDDGR